MNFASYADFRNGFLTLLTGDSATDGALDFGQTELLIQAGEDRVYNGDALNGGLRARTMLSTEALPIVSGVAALPAGFIEMASGEVDGNALEVVPNAYKGAGIRMAGDGLHVDGASLSLTYYKRPAALSAGLHSTFQRYPMLFLYGALVEGADFLSLPAKDRWEKKFIDLLRAANRQERVAAFNGGSARIRSR